MVVDQIENASRYSRLHPLFADGFEFLLSPGLEQLPDGRHDIDGDRIFAMISRDSGRGKEESLLEAHRRYIDIQYILAGEDCIGWMPTAACDRISSEYDASKDLIFFFDRPATWLALPAGTFALFFPEDAHAPLATQGPIHKIIVKVGLA